MKRIGLISDSHGPIDERIIAHLKSVDEIWHAGDLGDLSVCDQLRALKPTRIVYGNIDGGSIRRETKAVEVFEIEGLKICMTHIAGRPEKLLPTTAALVQTHRPGLFVCGHSHIALVKYVSPLKMLWMNPGACGFKGFHKVRTMLRFSVQEGACKDLELIELPRYSKEEIQAETSH
jgi:putative phosphoesterase